MFTTNSVSKRMRALAKDPTIWKTRYLETFGKPRSRRPPSRARRSDRSIDWNGRFKTKTNWSNGKAKLHEVEVARPPARPIIAKVQAGMIFTCDTSGLRAWSSQDGSRILRAQTQLDTVSQATCIAAEMVDGKFNVLLGFNDGSFSIYIYHREKWEHHMTQTTTDGPLTALSLSDPFAATVSRSKCLSIHQLASTYSTNTIIARVQSDASLSPLSISLRRTPTGIVAAIAYAFSRFHSGWCIGLQEIRLSVNGEVLNSRLASTLETPIDTKANRQRKWDKQTRSASSTPLPLHPVLMGPPTSLSYEHPYLIGTLADNTIMSLLVTSNDEKLEISSGSRLWGHTSAVSGAEVNNRGKAVSISSRGDETRVWELQTVMPAVHSRASTQVRAVDAFSNVTAALAQRGPGLGLALREVKCEFELYRRWVGFDEQQVAVLGETADERQIMALYDFT